MFYLDAQKVELTMKNTLTT